MQPRRLSASRVDGVRLSLWRAVSAFRVASLALCGCLIGLWQPLYQRPLVAVLAAVGMALVTAVMCWLGVTGRAHRCSIVAADVLVTAGLTLLTIPAQTPAQYHGSMVTLTTIWAAAPTLGAGFVLGPAGGVAAALIQFGVAAGIAGSWEGRTLYSGVLLLLAGGVVGYVARLATRAEGELRAAVAQRAALAERERLTRSIHDGVLQVLGLVHRTGAEADGAWPALAREAAAQEAALRALLIGGPDAADQSTRGEAARTGESRVGSSPVDLGAVLRPLGATRVTVATPSEPVTLPARDAALLGDAVRAALHNVEQHAGPNAHAWLLLEADRHCVRVTVRDDGVGFAAGRLAEAERAGRLGVPRSIRGRLVELGGTCEVRSTPGQGTEVFLAVPQPAARSAPR